MQELRFESLPLDLTEWKALWEQGPRTPEKVCALFLLALDLYTQKREDGLSAIDLLRGPRPMSTMEKQFLRDRLMDKAYLPLSYFEGAKPENNYQPETPYRLSVYPDPRPQDLEENYMRLYLKSGGADSPRPMVLRKKGEDWFLWDYPGILMGIRLPAKEDPWL